MKKALSRFCYLWIFGLLNLVLLVASVVHITAASDRAADGSVVPSNVANAVADLDAKLSDESKEKLLRYNEPGLDVKSLSFDEFLDASSYLTKGHMGIGSSLRNNWGLWEESRLKRWFQWRGVVHADEMSGLIMDEYLKHLNGENVSNYLGYRIGVLFALSGVGTLLLFVLAKVRGWLSRNQNGSGNVARDGIGV